MKIDENLIISFPGIVSQLDTSIIKGGEKIRIKAFKSEKEYSTFAVLIIPNETNVDNTESLHKVLAEMTEGALTSMTKKGISCITGDTIVDKVPGIKLICKSNTSLSLNDYMFLVNDKIYALQIAYFPNNSDIDRAEISNKTSIKEQQFASKAESIGYKIGYYLIPVLLFIGIIIYVVRKL